MGSFIEKFTFYDILGYGLPGFFFLVVYYLILYPIGIGSSLTGFFSNDTITILAVLVFSHITGSVLSEISRQVWRLLEKAGQRRKSSGSQDKEQDAPSEFTDIKRTDEINRAEANSGLFPKSSQSAGKLTKAELRKMYADIQTDQRYNRIHNYSSVEVMCKNLSAALFLGGIVAFLYAVCLGDLVRGVLSVLLFACGVLMDARAKRFRDKKEEYAVWWFVEKHVHKNDEIGSCKKGASRQLKEKAPDRKNVRKTSLRRPPNSPPSEGCPRRGGVVPLPTEGYPCGDSEQLKNVESTKC